MLVKHKQKQYFWKPVLANEREARSSMNLSLQVSQKPKKETLIVSRVFVYPMYVCVRVCLSVGVSVWARPSVLSGQVLVTRSAAVL